MLKPANRPALYNLETNVSNAGNNIERVNRWQNNIRGMNLQFPNEPQPTILQSFNDSHSDFPSCDIKTNNGNECLNPANLSVNTPNNCNNYCMSHSDSWIDSMTTNPYEITDINGKLFNSDLIYDITTIANGKDINQYLPSLTNIQNKYKLEFKINGNLNLQTLESNELVEQFVDSENKSNELVNEFTKTFKRKLNLNNKRSKKQKKDVNKINWIEISENPNYPITFYEEHINELDWEGISRNINIPIWFYEKYINKLDWYWISRNPNIPISFYKTHVDKLDWRGISINPNIPLIFYLEHIDNLDWYQISRNPNIPIINIEFYETYINKLDWEGISENKNIPLWFYKKYADKANWKIISRRTHIPSEFYQKYLHKLDNKQSNDSLLSNFLNSTTPIESTSIKLTDLSNNKTVNITQNDLEYLDYAEFLKYCLNTTTVEHISKHLTNYNNSLTIKNKITKVDNSNEWRKNKGKKIIYSKTAQIKSKM